MAEALPWPEVRLGDICKVVRGGSPRPAGDPRYFGGDFIPWLTVAAITNVSPSQSVITEAVGFLTAEGSRRSRRFQPGLIVIANSGWKCGVAKVLGFECCGNDGIAALENLTGADPAFLTYWINSQTERLRSQAAAGNEQPNLNTDRIASLSIPLPVLAEQQAIAAALSDADGVVAGLERVIAKKRLIKQGAMQDLLTTRRRLPGFSGEWDVKKLGEVASIFLAPSKSRMLMRGGAFLVCDMGAVTRDGVLTASKTTDLASDMLEAGDLVMPKDDIGGGQIIGRVGLVPTSGTHVLGDHVYGIRLRMGAPKFVASMINSNRVNSELRTKVVGSAQLGLGRTSVAFQDLPWPKLDEQYAIAAVLSDMDAEIQTLEARLTKARAVKEGMMQNLLTGRVRLV